jgi:hypothetical protein
MSDLGNALRYMQRQCAASIGLERVGAADTQRLTANG